ncbi:uncharacterized protein LOC117319407 [Pecten maximus]|uniref:uncharacterized protein LOC117319407 n=1 Tax=Pecten maximus TaxID=6579 RepID=UPI001458022E|nr:uncharacterized protein LOC117319407 [Pecten maximus]
MYSEDSTGYNTDLLTLNSSVDGNTSSDTLLFQPVRLPTAHTSPTCGIHGTWAPLAKGKGEQVFHLTKSPRAHPNATDDGYASNGYFSSLDRDSSTTPDQFRVITLQNTVHDNTTEPFVYREVSNSKYTTPGSQCILKERQ